jgi:thioesterase domain-containing protein
MADGYLARIRAIQPEGPYLLLGSSFGGLLSYEIAAKLRYAGQRAGLVAIVDAVPALPPDGVPPLDTGTAEHAALRILLTEAGLGHAAGEHTFANRAAAFAAVQSTRGPLGGVSDGTLSTLADLCAWHIRLAHSYRPPRYDGMIVLFSAAADPAAPGTAAKAAAWRRMAAAVRVHELGCTHDQVMQPQAAAAIARALSPILQEL